MKKVKYFAHVSMKFLRGYVRTLRKAGYQVSCFIIKFTDGLVAATVNFFKQELADYQYAD